MPTYSAPLATSSFLQNEVIALPSRKTFVKTSAAVEHSHLVGGAFAAMAGLNTTGLMMSGGFIRCTTGAVVVTVGA